MDQLQEVPTPPTIFRSSWVRWLELILLGLIGIAGGWLLLVFTTTTQSALTFPVLGAIISGTLSLLLGLHHLVRRSPDVAVDDHGVTFGPFGRIPWAGISRIHLRASQTMRYLAIELVEPGPKPTERRWPRWVYGPIGKIYAGYPLTVSERWLRPISLDDIADELLRRNPDLVITRSEQSGLRWW
ncbi:hypothetical protein [Nocardia sp. NPDC023988]|uniref:hypothetical protein n=1 Tax=unclassified Nocardia TaxID=2637762 RepID=UPI0034006CEE